MVVGGGRPNLMLAQVQVFCLGPGPGPDLTGTGPGMDLGPGMGPGMGPGPELDNISEPEQIICPFIKEDQRMEGIVPHLLSRLKTGCLDLGLEEASLGIHSFLLEEEIK